MATPKVTISLLLLPQKNSPMLQVNSEPTIGVKICERKFIAVCSSVEVYVMIFLLTDEAIFDNKIKMW